MTARNSRDEAASLPPLPIARLLELVAARRVHLGPRTPLIARFPQRKPLGGCCRFKYLAERCWAELPEVRPSLQQLYNELENLQVGLVG